MTLLRNLLTGLILLVISAPSYAQSAGDVWVCAKFWGGIITDKEAEFTESHSIEKLNWKSVRQFEFGGWTYKTDSPSPELEPLWYFSQGTSIFMIDHPDNRKHKLLILFIPAVSNGIFSMFENNWYECVP